MPKQTQHQAAFRNQQLLVDLIQARGEVIDVALALPPVAQDIPFLGIWSAHDIMAHLIGWDHAYVEAIEAIRSGRLPAFYAAYDADWRTFNAELVARYKLPTLEQTAAAAQASHRALVSVLESLPADDLNRDFGVRSARNRRVTIAMLLGVEVQDERTHSAQIRAFAASGQHG